MEGREGERERERDGGQLWRDVVIEEHKNFPQVRMWEADRGGERERGAQDLPAGASCRKGDGGRGERQRLRERKRDIPQVRLAGREAKECKSE